MVKKTTTALNKRAASEIDLAAPVAQRVELEDIRLVETVARVKSLPGKQSAHVSINVNVQTDTNKKQRVIHVRPAFVLMARVDDASGEELLHIEAIFLLRYRVPSFQKLLKANVTAFGRMNGLYNAWPYWREFVQATTVRMGLPALTIPVYRPIAMNTSRKRAASGKAHVKRAKKRRAV